MKCNYFLIPIVVLILSSCEEFLTITPTTDVSDETLWNNNEVSDLFLNGIYSSLPRTFNTDDPPENYSDNAISGLVGTYSKTVVIKGIYTPDNAPSAWGRYGDIRKCNLFIHKVQNSSDLSEDWKTIRLAEARFLRAYFYSLLWTFHGGVPIITDVLNLSEQGDEVFRPRSTAEETYQFIVNELSSIATDLPISAENGRASRGAALTLRGWCELFWASPLYNESNDVSRWETAANTFKEVIEMNVYELFPDYGQQFYEDNNFNQETIFARTYLGGTSLGSSREGLQATKAIGSQGTSWGGVNATQDLVDEYFMANGLPIDHPDSGYDPQKPYDNRSERFYQSIIYDGSFWGWDEIIMKQGTNSLNMTRLSDVGAGNITGYYFRKGLDPKHIQHGHNLLSSANEILFRYAEVLLGYAEAQNEAFGPDESVYSAINQVRERVSLPPLTNIMSKSELRNHIKQERRVELAFENKRYLDLIRWKDVETLNRQTHSMIIENVGGNWTYNVVPTPSGVRSFDPSKNFLFPIPQSAIDRNPKLVQNPGYN